MRYILILMVLVGCGRLEDKPRAEPEVQQDIQPIYKAFLKKCEERGSLTCFANNPALESIDFDADMSPDLLGQCRRKDGILTIAISPKIETSLHMLTMVVYHELGHCLLDLPHVVDTKDLMYSNSYGEHWDVSDDRMEAALDALFDRSLATEKAGKIAITQVPSQDGE